MLDNSKRYNCVENKTKCSGSITVLDTDVIKISGQKIFDEVQLLNSHNHQPKTEEELMIIRGKQVLKNLVDNGKTPMENYQGIVLILILILFNVLCICSTTKFQNFNRQ